MLDLQRLDRLELSRRPFSQRFLGRLLALNYNFFPGIELELENKERVPDTPVIYAMNHTDRYNYWPFQYALWEHLDRFTAAWVKGKYYESRFLAAFMESMAQLPTVSRGYLIARDFLSTMGRTPTDLEYELLRDVVDRCALGDPYEMPEPPQIPEKLLREARNPFGLAYEPDPIGGKGDYAQYICAVFRAMMKRFTELNEEAIRVGLDLLIFPQGTRSKRLLPGRVGIGQIALRLQVPIVPVGCNGSDGVYPGASPFATKGRIVYRIGEPIYPAELAEFQVEESYAPFTAAAERDHAVQFQGISDLVTKQIDALLDPEYQMDEDAGFEASRGVQRFV